MHNLVFIHILKFKSYILALQNIKFDDDDDWIQEEESCKFPSDLFFVKDLIFYSYEWYHWRTVTKYVTSGLVRLFSCVSLDNQLTSVGHGALIFFSCDFVCLPQLPLKTTKN